MPYKKKPAKKPNDVQLDVLKRVAASPDGRLIYMRGGFWTCRGVRTQEVQQAQGAFTRPDWYVATLSVRALERNGWLARTNTHVEDWKDERELTALGRAAIEATSLSLEG